MKNYAIENHREIFNFFPGGMVPFSCKRMQSGMVTLSINLDSNDTMMLLAKTTALGKKVLQLVTAAIKYQGRDPVVV